MVHRGVSVEQVLRRIVVLGASSGGVEALLRVLSELPADLDAAVFVVLHTSRGAPRLLADILARACKLPVRMAVHGEPITPGVVLVAPPDLHLLLAADHVTLDRGPTQNRMRPAVDALFRSAAVFHGAAVIGVVMTGSMHDGSVGLAAIKRCGGLAIVQDPSDARFPDMPKNAIAADSPDLVVPLAAIAGHISRAVAQRVPRVLVPHELELEAAPGLRTGSGVALNDRLGRRAAMSCPDCGGPLWELDEPKRFRCRIGHAYEEHVLLAAKSDEAVRALDVAVRVLDERAQLLADMAEQNRAAARPLSAEQYMLRHDELRDAAQTVRALIEGLSRATPGLEG